jgi:RND family efflux transporter MFP subunit
VNDNCGATLRNEFAARRGRNARAASLAVFSLLAVACGRATNEVEAPPVPSVKTEIVESTAQDGQRILSGVLLVAEETRLSFAVGGKLVSVPLREGEEFGAGQAIARLDRGDFERTVATQKARLASATSRLREAEDSFRRKDALGRTGALPRAEVTRAEAALASARADLQVAQVALAAAEEDLSRTTLVAPRDGIVTRLVAKQFEEIAPGQPVYEVGTRDALEVLFLVPEHLVPSLGYDAPVTITISGLQDRQVQGHIIEISANAEAGNAFRVRARLDEVPSGSRSGMTASVNLPVAGTVGSDAPIYRIPLSSLVFETAQTGPVVGARASIFVFDEATQTIAKREVTVRGMSANRVLVGEGVTAGERVVTAGVAFLRDGQSARLWSLPE